MALHLFLNQKTKLHGNGIRLIPCIYQISLGAQEYGASLCQLFRERRFFSQRKVYSVLYYNDITQASGTQYGNVCPLEHSYATRYLELTQCKSIRSMFYHFGNVKKQKMKWGWKTRKGNSQTLPHSKAQQEEERLCFPVKA